MKILQVNNVYGEKSTGVLTRLLHEGLLAAGEESLVIYGRGRGEQAPGVVQLCPDWYGKMNSLLSRVTGLPYGGCRLSTLRLQRIILREKPDVVHLQCINGNFVNIYHLVAWLKRKQIKTVVSLHAEFMYTGNCGHAYGCEQWKQGCKSCPNLREATRSWCLDHTAASWEKMRRAFAGFEKHSVLCPVSDWVARRAEQSQIVKKIPMRTVYNAVDGPFCFAETVEKENAVLHVTAHFSPENSHPKGGWYVLELAKRMPEITFYVAGKHEQVLNCPENVVFLGEITDRDALAAWYRRVKVTLVTSRAETFSMPCAESLCCGTPVVGFRAGGPEEIALPEYSAFVAFGAVDRLETALRSWLNRSVEEKALAEKARSVYSAETMVQQFLNVYRGLIWE